MLGALLINPLANRVYRFFGIASMGLALVLVVNNFLTYAGGLSGAWSLSFGGIFQTLLVMVALAGAGWLSLGARPLTIDAEWMDNLASTIVAMAFWVVLLVGVTDAILSFLRVEGLHKVLFGEEIAKKLGISSWRGTYVHIPMMILAAFIGWRDKSVSLIWLTFLVVLAELLIVIARFVFAYEQTFMADLVRFWYAALFLFASAYTLKNEGHVRVDVIFASFAPRKKAWVNAIGTLLLGIPLCWVVLWRGLSSKASIINSPMLNFETTMTGFGMYVKYLMAGFLIVFALSMLAQFTSYFFTSLAVLNGDTTSEEEG